MLDNIAAYKVVLASQSPRRRELLAQLRIPYEVRVIAGIREDYPADLPALEIAPYISRLKAHAYRQSAAPDELVITADTVVVCGGEVLGKPRDAEDARKMLRSLAGRSHTVVTGVTVTSVGRSETISVATEVTFGALTDEEIDYYVREFKPLDKAGAYGIQEWIGGVAVERIDGSFYNVMGLPIHQLYKLLKSF